MLYQGNWNRAIYFALLKGQNPEIGRSLSNYDKWWNEIQKAFDPNRVSPEGGALV